MSPISHPYRQELFDRWSAFLAGTEDRTSIAGYIETRIADYGPDELIHQGVQLLNDDLIESRNGELPSQARFEAWQHELVAFDEDPSRWKRDWARNYAERVLPGLNPASRTRFFTAIRNELTENDVEELAQRFDCGN